MAMEPPALESIAQRPLGLVKFRNFRKMNCDLLLMKISNKGY